MGGSFSVVRVQLYGPLVLAQVTVGIPPVVVGRSVIRVQLYGLAVVLYGPLSEIKCWPAAVIAYCDPLSLQCGRPPGPFRKDGDILVLRPIGR